jgi:hypothetical protein
MQSYPLSIQLGQERGYAAAGDLFVYESSTSVPPTGDSRIVVKPNSGTEIVLRPGQSFRLQHGDGASNWSVRALDPTVVIVGYVIIGSGEFTDANTVNTIKLDGSFANLVTVTNPKEQRIPTAETLTYGRNFAHTTAADVMLNIVTAAENVNGVWIEQISMTACSNAGSTTFAVIAKIGAATPLNYFDGEILYSSILFGSSIVTINDRTTRRMFVPAGRGVWFTQATAVGALGVSFKNVMVTIL